MMGKVYGAVAAAAAFACLTGTAHAGYAHVVPHGDQGYATFDALPHEAANLRIQVTDGGRTVTFEDLANPITSAAPLNSGGAPCQIVSAHKARCTDPDIVFRSVNVNTGLREARVTDLPGDVILGVDVRSGPLGDFIHLDDQSIVGIRDDGGTNDIALGAARVGNHIQGQLVEVGPGASKIDVRNGDIDYVVCMSPHAVWSLPTGMAGSGSPYPGEHNLLDTVLADPQDHLTACRR